MSGGIKKKKKKIKKLRLYIKVTLELMSQTAFALVEYIIWAVSVGCSKVCDCRTALFKCRCDVNFYLRVFLEVLVTHFSQLHAHLASTIWAIHE